MIPVAASAGPCSYTDWRTPTDVARPTGCQAVLLGQSGQVWARNTPCQPAGAVNVNGTPERVRADVGSRIEGNGIRVRVVLEEGWTAAWRGCWGGQRCRCDRGADCGRAAFVSGRRLTATRATTTTAASDAPIEISVFIRGSLQAGHECRRCETAGTWSSTASGRGPGGSGALLQPRANDAADLEIGAHCATSRMAGRASASRAARSPRIA